MINTLKAILSLSVFTVRGLLAIANKKVVPTNGSPTTGLKVYVAIRPKLLSGPTASRRPRAQSTSTQYGVVSVIWATAVGPKVWDGRAVRVGSGVSAVLGSPGSFPPEPVTNEVIVKARPIFNCDAKAARAMSVILATIVSAMNGNLGLERMLVVHSFLSEASMPLVGKLARVVRP